MTKLRLFALLLVGVGAGLMSGRPAEAQVDQLISALTSNLGVTESQATAGSGAIFGLAQERLTPDEFTSLSGSVPGVEQLIGEADAAGLVITDTASAAGPIEGIAPSAGGLAGDLGDAAGGLLGSDGGAAGLGDLGSLAALAGPFSELGMSPEMVAQFVPIILDYVGSTGGGTAMSLLQGALLGG